MERQEAFRRTLSSAIWKGSPHHESARLRQVSALERVMTDCRNAKELERAIRTASQLPWAAPLLAEIERGRTAGLEEAAVWHDEQRKMAHVLASKSPLRRERFDRQAVFHNVSAQAIRALEQEGVADVLPEGPSSARSP